MAFKNIDLFPSFKNRFHIKTEDWISGFLESKDLTTDGPHFLVVTVSGAWMMSVHFKFSTCPPFCHRPHHSLQSCGWSISLHLYLMSLWLCRLVAWKFHSHPCYGITLVPSATKHFWKTEYLSRDLCLARVGHAAPNCPAFTGQDDLEISREWYRELSRPDTVTRIVSKCRCISPSYRLIRMWKAIAKEHGVYLCSGHFSVVSVV